MNQESQKPGGGATSGALLRRLRAREGLTLTELAARIETGRGYLSAIEADQRYLSRELAERLACVFGLPPWELMYPSGWAPHAPEGW